MCVVLALAPFPVAIWLTRHWPALGLLILACLLLVILSVRRSGRSNSWLLGVALVPALPALGGLLLPVALSGWLVAVAGIGLALLVCLLLLTGYWSRVAALLLTGLLLLALGGWMLPGAGERLTDLGRSLREMRLGSPWWLILLVLVPAVIAVAWPRLDRQEVRPWLALALRCLGVVVLTLALAEPYFSQASRDLTVLFVVDRSLSIPEELGDDPARPEVKTDLRVRRILRFINESVARRGAGHERDRAGLILFGRSPRLELPPSDAPRFDLRELPSVEDGNYTNIAAALKLALASFPEGSARRIVLLSDGNQNQGDTEEQAQLARTLNVQIDVVPLATDRRNTDEVLVERVDAPAVIEQGARVPIRVLVRSHHPQVVVGKLTLRQITEKEGTLTLMLDRAGRLGVEGETIPGAGRGVRLTRVDPGSPAARAGLEPGEDILKLDNEEVQDMAGLDALLARRKAGDAVRLTMRRNPIKILATRQNIRLRLGLNPFSFDRPLGEEQRSYTYEAEFEPQRIEDEQGRLLSKGLPGDRVQNNRASTHVVARGQGKILLLEDRAGQHRELVQSLIEAGKNRFKVVAEPIEILDNYRESDKLAVFLSNFDCVILANIPAERTTEEQREVFRANTHDQGCGLIMIGGPDSFGAGGWQNTAVEKALPVDCDIRSRKVTGKGGLVMIMHASEMAQGNFWQKRIAKLAVERLGPTDEVGIIDYDFVCKWHVTMQEAGPNRARILAAIDRMNPGDMPDFDPALEMAHKALMDPTKGFAARHIIIISDGDPTQFNKVLLNQIKTDKITIATVGVATHGEPEDQKMTEIASRIPGTNQTRYYKVTDPKQLPAIYIKESRMVSQAFVSRQPFEPRLVYRAGPTARLPDLLPLGGFVRTTPKTSPLVEMPILSPRFGEEEFPILAHWHYGLGKAVAFTSDAGQPEFWARSWLTGAGGQEGIFAGFWEQVLAWALRPTESGRLLMNTEVRDGKIRVIVEAQTPDGKPDTTLRLRGGVTQPGKQGTDPSRPQELRFVQKNSGQYVAEVKADEAGSYFLNAQATRIRKVQVPGQKNPVEVEEGTDSVRGGVTLPYSPEFANLESNVPLLERLAEVTGGRLFEEDDAQLQQAASSGAVFRPPLERARSSLPFHHWLLFVAAGLLLLDVAVRRLAWDTVATREALVRLWTRLRGQPLPPPMPVRPLERLGARTTLSTAPGPSLEGSSVPAPRSTPATPTTPSAAASPPSPAPAGGLENLLRAKKKVWEDRKKDTSE